MSCHTSKFLVICHVCLIVLIRNNYGQFQDTLKLSDVIKLANDSSLIAFKNKNLLVTGYWQYKSFIAQMKPSISISSTLANYNRSLTQRYNSVLSIDEFRVQQSVSSNTNVEISQSLFLTGGTLSLSSGLNRLQNFGDNRFIQYSTIPISIDLTQPFFAFNTLKWQRKIEPLKYEIAKKNFIKSSETISLQAVDYFFDYAAAKKKIEIAAMNIANADTFYRIGQKRFEMGSLTSSDLLILRVSYINALNDYAESQKSLLNSKLAFNQFLNLSDTTSLELFVPDQVPAIHVSYEDVLNETLLNNPDFLVNKKQILESERDLEQAHRNKYVQSSVSLSYGLNQQNSVLPNAYKNPFDRQGITLTIFVPIIDWGQRTGNYKVAKSSLELTNMSVKQAQSILKDNIKVLVFDFNMQHDIVNRASEALLFAQQAYNITKQRFLIGKVDVNSLGIVYSTYNNAMNQYLYTLKSYWEYFYNLRIATLYDFETKRSLLEDFEKRILDNEYFRITN